MTLVVVEFQQLRHDLSIGLGLEPDALTDQKFLDLDVVFDDAVVDDGKLAVFAHVVVRVDDIRRAVRRPAGVTKADAALEARAAVDLFAEDLEPAHRFFDLQLSLRRNDGHARGVIPAVFQMREPVQQDGGRLFLTNESNDSAHMITFSF